MGEGKRMYYFAYGSNMNLEQMASRCSKASKIGPATLAGYRLTFVSRHRDGCGVGNIVPDCKKFVPGLLWKITEDDEKSLDIYEGYPHMYTKETIQVGTQDGRELQAMVYVMTPEYNEPAEPHNTYFFGILRGYVANKIDYKPLYEAVRRTVKEIKAKEKADTKGEELPGQQKFL